MKKIITTTALSILGLTTYSQNLPSGSQTDKANDVQLNTITTAVPFLIITPDSRAGEWETLELQLLQT